MDLSVVNAKTGRATGSASSRRLRRDGRLPGVVYGRGDDSVAVDVDYVSLRDALDTDASLNTVINLDVDGSEFPVVVRSIQRDAISRLVTHADFLRVEMDTPVKLTVPIHLSGNPIAVIEAGSFVEQKMFQLEILVKPSAIPNSIEVDITNMEAEARLALSDVSLPEGSKAVTPGHITVAASVVTRASKMADEEEAAAAEAAEAAEAEGDVAAGDGDAAPDAGDSE